MVAGSVTQECPVAVPADLLWKAAFSGDVSILSKAGAGAGMIDAVEVEGDGGVGSAITMKLNPSMGGPTVFKSRLLARDVAARVVRSEIKVEGGDVPELKSQVSEVKVAPAGEGTCVVTVTVEYERVDGEPLSPEDQAKIVQGYLGLIKMVEAYLVAHPGEVA